MENNTQPTPSTPRNRLHTALFAAAALLIPVLLGLFVVVIVHKLRPAAQPPALGTLASRLDENTVTNLTKLLELQRDVRSAGENTEELNLRIWSALALQPAVLFHIAAPDAGKQWTWHLSQDGLYAIAIATQPDTLGHRSIGLFDLIAEEWLWKNILPWPDMYESPYVFNRHVVLRYTKNMAHFALEIDAHGKIIDIATLGKTPFSPSAPMRPLPGFPGNPVGIKNGVLFTADAHSQALVGYALERVPALRYAGKGDENTLFSGNGLLKFTLRDGYLTVADSLSQTVLQRIDAWPHTTNTVVTGARVTHDGSLLSVFLKTAFAGTPVQAREWCVAIATYTGKVTPSFNADALLAKPRHINQLQTLSSDGLWSVSVSTSNVLSVASQTQNRELARLSLNSVLNARTPVNHIAFLEDNRHLLIRQSNDFWLLDLAAARSHADLLARLSRSVNTNVVVTAGAETVPTAAVESAAALSASTNAPVTLGDPACSRLALRAQWYASYQAWGYAAAALEEAALRSASDGRAPRVNPLLLAHALLLSGQPQKARLVCRKALMELISDTSDYNRMIRYQLQGLLFAQP